MKIFKYISRVGMLTAVALLAACSDKDDYAPGPEVPAGCQQVRFADTNHNTFVLDTLDTNNRTATLTLKRNNNGAALTVPITVVSKADGVEIPTEATFAAGDSLAQISVTGPQNYKLKDVFNYELRLEGNDVDPYTRLDGGAVFSGSFKVPASREATFWIDDSSNGVKLFYEWKETLFDLGNGNFFINDFMHSGTNLWLYTDGDGVLSIKSDAWTKDCVEADNSNANCYHYHFKKMKDGELASYPLYPLGNDGSQGAITELRMYGGPTYSSYSVNGLWGKIYIAHATYSNNTADNWVYLYFQFK